MMKRELPQSQLTAQTIRRAIDTLRSRTDLPDEARARGVDALTEALSRLHPSYSKMAQTPIRQG